MLEKIVLDYLDAELSAPVYMEMPLETPVGGFVVIEKTAESAKNRINYGTLAVQTYGETLYDAAELAEEVKSALDGIPTLDTIYSCKLNSSYNFTDTATKRYRYQSVFNFVF